MAACGPTRASSVHATNVKIAALTELLLAVEIVSPGSAAMDEVVKLREYAEAGIPRYWMVERDAAQTVTLNVLGVDKAYEVAAKMPLAWLLQTAPAGHHLRD